MSDYIVWGKKGNGKSLVCVGRMRDALLAGKPVATNLNLNLDRMTKNCDKSARLYRLPDRPRIGDMLAIGRGSDSVDEASYGVIVLDETAAWLNTRTYSDKGRQELLDWFVHSRKLGWDVYFICQNPVQIDKQIRESLAEMSVSCKRMDKLRIPFIGSMLKSVIGWEPRPPKIHVATVRYGMAFNDLVTDRWYYRGKELYAAYDTQQVFQAEYPHGIHCMLPAWHTTGRYGSVAKPSFCAALLARFFAPPVVRPPAKPMNPLVGLVAALPVHQRLYHWRRLSAMGAI